MVEFTRPPRAFLGRPACLSVVYVCMCVCVYVCMCVCALCGVVSSVKRMSVMWRGVCCQKNVRCVRPRIFPWIFVYSYLAYSYLHTNYKRLLSPTIFSNNLI